MSGWGVGGIATGEVRCGGDVLWQRKIRKWLRPETPMKQKQEQEQKQKQKQKQEQEQEQKQKQEQKQEQEQER
eukprot:337590-Chlamydomonas_euryale.AAC.2